MIQDQDLLLTHEGGEEGADGVAALVVVHDAVADEGGARVVVGGELCGDSIDIFRATFGAAFRAIFYPIELGTDLH